MFTYLFTIDLFPIFIYSAKSISVEDSTVWTTSDKTFEAWICPLVYALISYCDDLILRLFICTEKNLTLIPAVFLSWLPLMILLGW